MSGNSHGQDPFQKEPFELKPSENLVNPENAYAPPPPETENEAIKNPPADTPQDPSQESPLHEDAEGNDTTKDVEKHDSIYDESKNVSIPNGGLAEINFDLLDTGRYLLKVVGGPNNGAEFSMQSQQTYIVGTDPNSCDIVFHDTSVSRQHARLTISQDDEVFVEDLKSRNGTLVDGKAIEEKTSLPTNSVVTLGTTSFIVYDREGNMQTIISPFLPEIVKALKKEEIKPVEEPLESQVEPIAVAPAPRQKPLGTFIVIAIITGLFVLMAIGTAALFRSEPIELVDTSHADAQLATALTPFKGVKYSFNKSTGRLLLVGHVLTQSDKNQLLYNLQGKPFIKKIDDSGVVIDELVWQNTNQIINRNPAWKGISIQSPSPGKFVLTGYLQNRKQAEQLYDYITANFPYLDSLQRSLIIEQDVVQSVSNMLVNQGIRSVNVQFSDGELILTGGVPAGKQDAFAELLTEFKKIPGVRQVRSQVANLVTDQSTINISDRYEVSGYSKQGRVINVMVNGRIITTGDTLDGMTINSISPNTILLEKDGVTYRIDYTR